LFYSELGGVADQSITTTHNNNYSLFSNIQAVSSYWMNTESGRALVLDQILQEAYYFLYGNGFENPAAQTANALHAWAVRTGDVTAVPLSGAIYLFGCALDGMAMLGKRQRGW